MAATEISVDHIARVEGHGDIRLVIEDGPGHDLRDGRGGAGAPV